MMDQVTNFKTADSAWKSLYKVTGVVLLIFVALYPFQTIIFMTTPQPNNVIEWFTLLQTNKFIGLSFEIPFLVENTLFILLYLALYVALKQVNESWMAIAFSLGFIGAVTLIVARPIFEILYLSDQYAAATTDVQRSIYLAAGEAVFAFKSGTCFNVSYVLGVVAMIIMCVVMLQSNIFSKAIAYIGILANVESLGLYVPTIGIYLAVFSVLLLAIWYILLARRFFQLGRAF